MLLIATILFLNYRDNKITLIQENIAIEYGNSYNPKIEELIDISKYNYINIDKVKLETNIENEQGKEYPAVGKYEVKVCYKNKTLIQKVEIKDTISPEIIMQDSVEIPFGTDLSTYNFKELININDLSEIKEFNINLDNVNSNVSGEYIAKVLVEDEYSNKSEKEFKIIVQEKQEETVEDTNNIAKVDENKSNSKNNNSVNKNNTVTQKNTSNNNNTTTNNASNSNNSTSNTQNNNTEQKNETVKPEEPVRCTNNNNHGI